MNKDEINNVIKLIKKKVNIYDTKGTLSLVAIAARILYESNICYQDADLEKIIQNISDRIKDRRDVVYNENYISNMDTVIFYDGFGFNSRGLVLIYLNALCMYKHVVYVTPGRSRNSIPDIEAILYKHSAEIYFIEGKQYVNVIKELNRIIQKVRPESFFFYSTPDDVAGTVVMNIYKNKINRYLINLTDHSFWLGSEAIDCCIDFRNYGANISRYYRKIPENKIVKIPYYPYVRNIDFQGYPLGLDESKKIVFSGGSIYKTIGGNGLYYKTIDYILNKYSDVVFWYAGASGSGDTTELEKIIERYPGRAFRTEERKDLFQILQHCYLYLSTFPLAGGLMTQYAARAKAVPVTLLVDNNPKELLLNEKELGLDFFDYSLFISEIDKLLSDQRYYEKKREELSESTISPDTFNYMVGQLLDGKLKKNNIVFEKTDTNTFRNEKASNYTTRLLNETFASKNDIIVVKYFPSRFFAGCFSKVKKSLRHYDKAN